MKSITFKDDKGLYPSGFYNEIWVDKRSFIANIS